MTATLADLMSDNFQKQGKQGNKGLMGSAPVKKEKETYAQLVGLEEDAVPQGGCLEGGATNAVPLLRLVQSRKQELPPFSRAERPKSRKSGSRPGSAAPQRAASPPSRSASIGAEAGVVKASSQLAAPGAGPGAGATVAAPEGPDQAVKVKFGQDKTLPFPIIAVALRRKKLLDGLESGDMVSNDTSRQPLAPPLLARLWGAWCQAPIFPSRAYLVCRGSSGRSTKSGSSWRRRSGGRRRSSNTSIIRARCDPRHTDRRVVTGADWPSG